MICLLATAAVLAGTPAEAAPRPCSSGLVALTFDDGPSPTQTPRLVKILQGRRVPATFFLVGNRVRSSPATARLVQRSGFGIANHTWSHPLLTGISDKAVLDQLNATARELRRHGLRPGPLMRPPYGGVNPRVAADIRRAGLVSVLWSVDSMDWSGGSAREIANRVLSQLRPHQNNVVLQHDGVNNSPNSISAVPMIVDEARRRGYCFTELNAVGRVSVPRPEVRATVTDGGERGAFHGTRPVRVVLTLDRPTTRAVSLRLRTQELSATAMEDFYGISERVTFPAGATRTAIRVRVLADEEAEGLESFRLLLDAATGVDVPRDRFLVHIVDDEVPSVSPAPEPTRPTPSPAAAPAPERKPGLALFAFDPWLMLR